LLTTSNNLVGFISVLFQPNPHARMWRVHRLVVLPDFQGIGLGKILLNNIAKYYKNKYKNEKFFIKTSSPALLLSLKNQDKWKLRYLGRTTGHKNLSSYNKTISSKRKTYSWEYV